MNDFLGIILGAVLAVGGGAINEEISLRRKDSRERKALSMSISDELTEILQVLEKIKTVWEATHALVPSYIRDLRGCTSTYDGLRRRLFLIKDKDLRKEITAFYRDIKSATNSDVRKAGSLSSDEAVQKKQQEIASKFIGFISRTESIQNKLKRS